MKVCSQCHLEKPLLDFNRKGKGLQPWCRECNRLRSRQYYRDNSDAHRALIKANKKKYSTRNRAFIIEYLNEHPCSCGESDIRTLQFDHLGNKTKAISAMLRDTCSIEALKDEIKKCQVLCANCHSKKTCTEANWYKNIAL